MIKHVHLNECDSTQIVLKEQLSEDANQTVLVSCENQVQGRGRGEKTWTTLPGTLCMSLNLKPHLQPSFTAIEIAVLVVKFFETKNQHLKLKWPNDLWNERSQKCCGILIQSTPDTMLTGIGLNLFSDDPEFGGVFESGFELEKKAWCADIASFVRGHRYSKTEDLIQDWEERCFHLKKRVRITEAGETFEGTFLGLGAHGEALLETSEGVARLYNGSLTLREFD